MKHSFEYFNNIYKPIAYIIAEQLFLLWEERKTMIVFSLIYYLSDTIKNFIKWFYVYNIIVLHFSPSKFQLKELRGVNKLSTVILILRDRTRVQIK